MNSEYTHKESEEFKPDSKEQGGKKISLWLFLSWFFIFVNAVLILFADPHFVFLISCVGIFSAIKAIKEINKSGKKGFTKKIAIGAIVFQAILFVTQAYWRIDAPPIQNDYTISDIKSALPEFNKTYELLLALADPNENSSSTPAIGLSEDDLVILESIRDLLKEEKYENLCKVIDSNSENILMLWNKSQKGRDIIEQLLTCDQIADLTEPYIEFDIKYIKNLRELLHIYRAYIYLQCVNSNFDEALSELIKLHTFSKKLNSNTRSLVMKLVCMGYGVINIKTANFIINNPDIPQKHIEIIADDFKELGKEHTSMRNQIIFEYLMTKNAYKMIIEEVVSQEEVPFKNNRHFTNMLKKRFSSSMLKYNSSLRLYRNCCNRWLAIDEGEKVDPNENFNVWPVIYPNLSVEIDSDGKVPRYYFIYNPIGSLLITILLPAYEQVFVIKSKYIVHNDLLQIVINKRLGKPFKQKVQGFGGEYTIDFEQEKIFNPGPDGENYTDDDVYLLINPKVLQGQ
ncbi:MAG: hypothetical protein JW804_00650 [Sedimentisphaerales bacterium]|nr:hypothetical protein [Sedimentisphaerales bacterium]